MANPNEPLKDVGAEGVKQVGKVLQNIVAQLRWQPTFLFGIASMLLAIVGVIALAFLPNLPSPLTWFPYALLVFGIILIGFAYLKMPQKSRRQDLSKTEDRPKMQSVGASSPQQNPKQVVNATKSPIAEEVSWPKVKTVKSLAVILTDMSPTQRQILRIISESNGVNQFSLAEKLKTGSGEIYYRLKDLERLGLIRSVERSDIPFVITDVCQPLFKKKTIQEIHQS